MEAVTYGRGNHRVKAEDETFHAFVDETKQFPGVECESFKCHSGTL